MAGPWEKYQQAPQDGPWAKYASAAPDPETARLAEFDRLQAGNVAGMSRFQRVAAGAGKAVSDIGRGAKQRLDEAAAFLESVVPGGQALSRATGGKTAAEIRDEGQAAIVDAKRRDAALMEDKWGVGGNIAGGMAVGAPLAPLGPVGMGAAMGYATPTTDGGTEVLGNMAMGAGAGWLGDKVVRGVSRVIQPKVRPEVQTLMREGVTPTPGQIMGGNAATLEAKATSLPIIGDAISAAQRRAGAELNRAVFARALAPIGEKLPNGMEGREAVKYVDDVLGGAYNKLLPKMNVRADQQFTQEISSLRQMVNTGAMDPSAAKTFNRILQNDVLGKFRGQNSLTGQTLKQIESDLGGQVARFANSTDADQRLVGDALREVQDVLRNAVQRSNPQHAKELKAINAGWANFKRAQRAASYMGADDGMFTAAQLQSAVKALDRSKDKARFAEGRALMQDLSDAAKSVMGPKYPDSGTAGRVMNVGAILSGIHQPAIPASLAGGSLLYSRPMQEAIAAGLTKRPGWAPLLASEVEALAPLGGLLGYSGAAATQ